MPRSEIDGIRLAEYKARSRWTFFSPFTTTTATITETITSSTTNNSPKKSNFSTAILPQPEDSKLDKDLYQKLYFNQAVDDDKMFDLFSYGHYDRNVSQGSWYCKCFSAHEVRHRKHDLPRLDA